MDVQLEWLALRGGLRFLVRVLELSIRLGLIGFRTPRRFAAARSVVLRGCYERDLAAPEGDRTAPAPLPSWPPSCALCLPRAACAPGPSWRWSVASWEARRARGRTRIALASTRPWVARRCRRRRRAQMSYPRASRRSAGPWRTCFPEWRTSSRVACQPSAGRTDGAGSAGAPASSGATVDPAPKDGRGGIGTVPSRAVGCIAGGGSGRTSLPCSMSVTN